MAKIYKQDGGKRRYFKVLVNGKSCHGGVMAWSLPTTKRDGTPKRGKWMRVPNVDDIKVCNYGIHLTSDFMRWLKPGCSVYEVEHGDIFGSEEDKIVTDRARLMREVELPDWWNRADQFIATIPQVPFFKPDGSPKHDWKLFKAPTLDAARAAAGDTAWAVAGDAAWNAVWDAARNAVWDAARDAAWNAVWAMAGDAAWNAVWDAARDAAWNAGRDAARDAAWMSLLQTCTGLSLDQKHIDHLNMRWEVWQKGYSLLGDVDGVLYVYATEESKNEGGSP